MSTLLVMLVSTRLVTESRYGVARLSTRRTALSMNTGALGC